MKPHFYSFSFVVVCILGGLAFKQDNNKQTLVYRAAVSFEKYLEDAWTSPKDSVYFANTILDSSLSNIGNHIIYEKFRVYCDTTKREGNKYYWAIKVRTCTYMDREATYSLGITSEKFPHKLGRQKSESHCRLTTFGAMLPISPKTKTVWLKIENLQYARVD